MDHTDDHEAQLRGNHNLPSSEEVRSMSSPDLFRHATRPDSTDVQQHWYEQEIERRAQNRARWGDWAIGFFLAATGAMILAYIAVRFGWTR